MCDCTQLQEHDHRRCLFYLIEPNKLGTVINHYLKTSHGRIVEDENLTLYATNMEKDFDILDNVMMSQYGMSLFDFEICNRFGPLAHETSPPSKAQKASEEAKRKLARLEMLSARDCGRKQAIKNFQKENNLQRYNLSL